MKAIRATTAMMDLILRDESGTTVCVLYTQILADHINSERKLALF